MTTKFTLTPAAPYRFDYFQERVGTSSNNYLYALGDHHLSRAHMIDDHSVLVHVTPELRGDEPPLIHVEVSGAHTQRQVDEAVKIWRHALSVDRPLLPFYEQLSADPVFKEIIDRLYGMHLILDPGPFESMINAIIGQQVNLTFAENLKRALVELCGDVITLGDQTYYVFPSPAQIARLNYEDLRPLKFSQRKAEYIIDFSRNVVNGTVDLELLEKMSNEEAIEYLVKLRGIGRWSAECVLLFGLGRPNLLPAADIGLRNAIQHFYGWEYQPTEAEVREFATGWRGYESYATYYMWTALGIARAEQKQQKSTAKTK
jgi:DNA-3-methyladenine glycosylase II